MVESEAIEVITNQVATKAVTAVMMTLRDTDMGSITAANITSLKEILRQRHSRPVLERLSFNWNT